MANTNVYLTLLLLLSVLKWVQSTPHSSTNYVQDACSVTQYRALCINTLAPFSTTAKTSPSKWARAGVSITIGETKKVTQYLMKVKNYRTMKGSYKIPLSDCIECLQDAIDQLHGSLGVLRKLNARNFYAQMGDITTWLSAVLTDHETCLDGFENPRGKQAKMVRNRVLRSSYFTSNALALVNKLATSGLDNTVAWYVFRIVIRATRHQLVFCFHAAMYELNINSLFLWFVKLLLLKLCFVLGPLFVSAKMAKTGFNWNLPFQSTSNLVGNVS